MIMGCLEARILQVEGAQKKLYNFNLQAVLLLEKPQ